MDIDQHTSLQVNVENCSFKTGWMYVRWNTTLSIHLELFFTSENINSSPSCVGNVHVNLHVCISAYTVPHLYTGEFSDC